MESVNAPMGAVLWLLLYNFRPTLGQLVPSHSILVEREYEFKSFTDGQRIESTFFPDLDLNVEQVIAFGAG
jgi:hypothetical protein